MLLVSAEYVTFKTTMKLESHIYNILIALLLVVFFCYFVFFLKISFILSITVLCLYGFYSSVEVALFSKNEIFWMHFFWWFSFNAQICFKNAFQFRSLHSSLGSALDFPSSRALNTHLVEKIFGNLKRDESYQPFEYLPHILVLEWFRILIFIWLWLNCFKYGFTWLIFSFVYHLGWSN